MTAAFEGIEGSYSQLVLGAYAARRGVAFEPLGCPTYRATVHAVLSGRADVGLLPVDNAIAGTIREGYDVLAEYELDPLAEITWRMEHRLLGLPGATLADIRTVDSHPVVLAECGRFLGTLTDVRRYPVPDTGIAARDVAASGDLTRAAIASAEAGKRYGLVELAQTLRIPVFLNGLARGCLAADDELFFSRARSHALKGADVALVVGVPMDFRLAFGAAFGEETQIVVIDSAQPERAHPREVAAELYGSPAATLSDLRAAAGGAARNFCLQSSPQK